MLDHKAKNLVSCIMPTFNRRGFVPQAVWYFLRQDYENRELIVVDDGDDAIADLIPNDDRIRYVRLNERHTVGAKRNIACECARGKIIAHWDDDDWHAPHRLSYQVEALLREGAAVCGINRLLFYDLRYGCGRLYVYPPEQRLWLSGSTLCYTKSFWAQHRFADVDVGEDARFVWSSSSEKMFTLPDSTFHVGMIHPNNVSPKQTDGCYWQEYPSENLKRLIGDDWAFYESSAGCGVRSAKWCDNHNSSVAVDLQTQNESINSAIRTPHPAFENSALSSPQHEHRIRNVFACLVHEQQECVVDLVRNLKYHDPDSVILLYNGGHDQNLLNHGFPFEKYGAVIHPTPRPMRWGWLHDFALDCMKFSLENFTFDTMTIVDSDQLSLREGYSRYLAAKLEVQTNVGMLGNSPERQPSHTRIPPAVQAWREFDLWLPFLRRFENGEEKFVHWSFWPSTVFTNEAARALTEIFSTDEQLRDIMYRSQIWATEEIILPTLVALLGFRVEANPCNYDLVQYRARYSYQQVDAALNRDDAFWIHPVTRHESDALRKHIRARCNQYKRTFQDGGSMNGTQTQLSEELFLTHPILTRMRKIEGWLEDEEADLLIAATTKTLSVHDKPHTIVEIGSYCGRSTVVLGSVARAMSDNVRIYAIDPHDGKVGALDQGIQTVAPTLERFRHNINDAGLTDLVEVIQKFSYEVEWSQKPIHLLFIDGLHDYTNVARDFFHFAEWVAPNGYVTFHDYADYYPGVKTFVNELLSQGQYQMVNRASSMIVVKRIQTH
jgi:glycosyltransferase involved in cell wall biosynthesis/predicted O-methyltransferase YrrM